MFACIILTKRKQNTCKIYVHKCTQESSIIAGPFPRIHLYGHVCSVDPKQKEQLQEYRIEKRLYSLLAVGFFLFLFPGSLLNGLLLLLAWEKG